MIGQSPVGDDRSFNSLKCREKEIINIIYSFKRGRFMEKRLMTVVAGLALSTSMAFAQSQISGNVTASEDGSPVIGASIKVVGTNTGTVTDIDGNFSLSAPAGAKLEITYIGMQSKSVKAGKNMKIVLDADNHSLDEVMVVAYGTAKKSSFTGSAAVLKSDEIAKISNSNAVSALTGKVSGVQINAATGQPGQESFNIRVRGISSINAGNAPLIVVDGSPYDGDMNSINPGDIASMTVLKDAASAALYGARGANGVVIITTKSGRDGSTSFTFDAKWGSNSKALPDYNIVKSPAKYYETWYAALNNYAQNKLGYSANEAYGWANKNMINSSDYGLNYNVYSVPTGENLIGVNGKLNPNATLGNVINYNGKEYMLMPDDWRDASYQNGLRQEYTLTATANSTQGSFYGSANYLKNEGITMGSDYTRFTGRMKADYQIKSWLKVSGNMNYTHSDSNYLGKDGDSADSGNMFAVNSVAPIYPLYIRDGKGNVIFNQTTNMNSYDYGDGAVIGLMRPIFQQSNPISDIQLETNNVEGNTFNAVGSAEVRFLKDFKFTSTNSTMVDESRQSNLSQPFFGQPAKSNGYVSKSHIRRWSYNFQQLLNWHHQFGEHDVEAMVGHEYYRTRYYVLAGSKSNIFSIFNSELDAAIVDGSISSYTTDYNTEGFFGRAQYNYSQKYFGSFSYRRDASSRFDPDHRWGNFWSFGGAWILSKEKWFESSWIDELKLKASYGEQGNDNIGDYLYTDRYSIGNSNGSISLKPSSTKGNRKISWEKGGNLNVGTEFSLWKGRLTGSVEYFYRKTSDMLAFFSLPVSYGYSGYYDNVGDMRNSGVELELNGDIIRTKDFTWSANLNFTAYKNKITSMPDEKKALTVDGVSGYAGGGYFYGEGQPIYTWYMAKYAGVDKETGEALYYKDTDKGETTTTNASEATMHLCGTALPDAYGGFGTSVSYKGFDFSMDFTYQLGGKIYDSSYASLMGISRGYSFHADLLDAWTPSNTSSNIPRIQYGDSYAAYTSDRFLVSGSYLSLQDVTLGYTLPRALCSKIGINKVRVYATGSNLWLWSKRQGLDPRQSITGATSNAYYSPIRTISGGITVTF